MSARPNYYTIGIFVVTGMILILAALIILGAGAMWRVQVTIETYADESVQGIETGSQVKMRGVQVGNVQTISFISIKYPSAAEMEKRYVLLEISLSLNAFGDLTQEEFQHFLEQAVDKGLRIRMQPTGITGSSYLEMDYLDPDQHPPLPINWTPEHPYVPTAPGTFTRLEETFNSFSKTMSRLEQLDLQASLENINQLVNTLDVKIQELDMKTLVSQSRLLLEELRESNRRIAGLVGPASRDMDQNLNIHGLLNQAGQTLEDFQAGLNRFLDYDQGQTPENLGRLIANLSRASEDLEDVLHKVSTAALSVRQGADTFQGLSRQTWSLLKAHNHRITSILRDMEVISANILELSVDAREYPSYILFGDKPQKSEQQ